MPNHKIALIGLGKWGKKLLPHLVKFGSCTIFTTGKVENISWLKENYDAVEHSTSLKTIRDNSFTHVFIATPIATHADLIKQMIPLNIPIWVEKPTSTSMTELNEIFDLLSQSSSTLFCNHIYTKHPFISIIKDEILSMKNASCELTWNKWGSFEENIVWNLAYHEISLANAFFSVPNQILKSANFSSSDPKNSCSFSLLYENLDVNITIDRESQHKVKSFIVKSLEKEIMWTNSKLVITEKNGKSNTFFNTDDVLELQLNTFFSSRNDTEINLHLKEIYDVTQITEKVANLF